MLQSPKPEKESKLLSISSATDSAIVVSVEEDIERKDNNQRDENVVNNISDLVDFDINCFEAQNAL